MTRNNRYPLGFPTSLPVCSSSCCSPCCCTSSFGTAGTSFLLSRCAGHNLCWAVMLLRSPRHARIANNRRHGKKAVALSEEETMPISIQTTKVPPGALCSRGLSTSHGLSRFSASSPGRGGARNGRRHCARDRKRRRDCEREGRASRQVLGPLIRVRAVYAASCYVLFIFDDETGGVYIRDPFFVVFLLVGQQRRSQLVAPEPGARPTDTQRKLSKI